MGTKCISSFIFKGLATKAEKSSRRYEKIINNYQLVINKSENNKSKQIFGNSVVSRLKQQ